MTRHILFAVKVLWALPCSMVGACAGLALVALGGTLRRVDHTFEIALRLEHGRVPRWARHFNVTAMTFGHVIVGQSHEALAALRTHERVHVAQYERLGPLFFLAYPASSLLAWMQGQSPYLGNRFEIQAFAQASRSATEA